jgi:uncharacterized protein
MKCPSCRAAVKREGNQRFPFCSERCRMVDLGRWVNEEYRVPEEPDASGGGAQGLPDTDREN